VGGATAKTHKLTSNGRAKQRAMAEQAACEQRGEQLSQAHAQYQ